MVRIKITKTLNPDRCHNLECLLHARVNVNKGQAKGTLYHSTTLTLLRWYWLDVMTWFVTFKLGFIQSHLYQNYKDT